MALKNDLVMVPKTTLTFFIARQTNGKTTVIRHLREKADAAGNPFPIINLETNKPGIAQFIKSAVFTLSETATSPEALHDFVFRTVERLVGERASHILVDTNGEDERLLALARRYPLGEIFTAMQVDAQLFFIGGADRQDLAFLQQIEKSGSFRDAVSILGFAAHSCKTPDPHAAYETFRSAPIIDSIKKRDKRNRIVLIPSCAELEEIQHVTAPLHDIGRIGGMHGDQPHIPPWTRSRIRAFCTNLDLAFVDIAGLLP